MYFIVTIKDEQESRCIGYESSLLTAATKILSNACDMFEDGYYRYAVILKIQKGLYGNISEQGWYQYQDNKIEEIPRPVALLTYIPYAIG